MKHIVVIKNNPTPDLCDVGELIEKLDDGTFRVKNLNTQKIEVYEKAQLENFYKS